MTANGGRTTPTCARCGEPVILGQGGVVHYDMRPLCQEIKVGDWFTTSLRPGWVFRLDRDERTMYTISQGFTCVSTAKPPVFPPGQGGGGAGAAPWPGDRAHWVGAPNPYAPTPEPPLRVGDWVRDDHGCTWQIANEYGLTNCHGLTRIEPPVGWPVGVPTIDAPTVWYFKSTSSGKYVWCGDVEIDFSWSELVAAGGVPALAVTR